MSGDLIIPGDFLPIETDSSIEITIGPGIYKNPRTQNIVPTNAGLLNIQKSKAGTSQLVYIESNIKRYTPQTNDFVIGIVTGVIGESYKVQLQDFSPAVLLSMMAFPNATKKNRPNLKIGQAVYARVSEAIPQIETELECIDPTTGKEGGFGLLDESGYIFEINLNFARELLFNANSIFLEKLASKCKFEIAVGINGKVWIKCGEGIKIEKDKAVPVPEEGKPTRDDVRDLKSTLAAAGFLVKCQKLNIDQIDAELQKQFKNI